MFTNVFNNSFPGLSFVDSFGPGSGLDFHLFCLYVTLPLLTEFRK